MAIGIDDFVDDFENEPTYDYISQEYESVDTEDTKQKDNSNDIMSDTDMVSYMLKSKGIDDRSKIKFEDEDGDIREISWDSLSNEDKLNILNSSDNEQDSDLDDTEVELINAIRESGMTPAEYLQYIQQSSINNYIQNNQEQNYKYSVDQYSDDELFITDFMSRMGDVTEEEAQEALERAKSNQALFTKQIGAIRNEYRTIEQENIRQAELEQEERAQEQYDQFTQSVENEIYNFTDCYGCKLDLDQDDMQELYEFITGYDAAGNNYFAKALTDPKTLVQTAWLALNGQQMVDDITDYFQKEITKVRQESYKKGMEDAINKNNNSGLVYRTKSTKSQNQIYNDLDDF